MVVESIESVALATVKVTPMSFQVPSGFPAWTSNTASAVANVVLMVPRWKVTDEQRPTRKPLEMVSAATLKATTRIQVTPSVSGIAESADLLVGDPSSYRWCSAVDILVF